MATLSQVKAYGGIGAILALLLPVPAIGWILAITGLVLTLVAVKYVSDILKDTAILENILISIVTAVGGIVVGVFVILAGFFRFMGVNSLNFADLAKLDPASITTGAWIDLITWAVAGVLAVWVLFAVSGFFLRRGYSRMGKALNVGMFGTAGLLFLIGAITSVLIVGLVLIPVALILLAIAFFSINENASQPVQVSASST